jgi:hypothetical protein
VVQGVDPEFKHQYCKKKKRYRNTENKVAEKVSEKIQET